MSSVRTYRDRVVDHIAAEFHACPGLAECDLHPRWHVFADRMNPGWWWAASPYWVNLLPSHAEAFAYAEKEATR